jgi:hypothetical protein
MSSLIKSREFLLAIIIAVSFFIYFPYFVESPKPIVDIESWLVTTTVVIASFAVMVSLYTMTRREVMRITKRVKGWPYSLLMMILAWFMIVVGVSLGKDATPFRFCADAFVLPGDSTIYAILVFYLTSAAARSFKVRDLESLLLLLGAFFVLMQQAPLGEYLFPYFGPIGSWLVNNLAMAASRVFTISATLGGIVLAIRLLAGKEMAMIGLIARREKD